jgi:hypothetical protein
MRKISFLIALFCLFFSKVFAEEVAQDENADPVRLQNIAQLQVLNKTTAKTSILAIKTGEKAKFGSITISVRKCWQAPLDQRPESKILIDVSEAKIVENKEKEDRIFYGWLFASSPSLSGIEHPIYDIVAIGCKNK